MGTQFVWFFDFVVVAILLIFLYLGGKRGFLRSVVLIVGYFGAFFAASYFSELLAPTTYDSLVRPMVVSSIEKKMDSIDITEELQRSMNNAYRDSGISFDKEEVERVIADSNGSLTQSFSDYITAKTGVVIESEKISEVLQNAFMGDTMERFFASLPTFMKESAGEYLSANSATLGDTIKGTVGTKETAAGFLEEHVLRSGAVSVLRIVLFFLFFGIAMLIVSLLARIFKGVNRVPIIGSVNALLGAVVGLAEGAIIIYVAALLIHLVIMLMASPMIVFNEETIQSTLLFKQFYNFKIF